MSDLEKEMLAMMERCEFLISKMPVRVQLWCIDERQKDRMLRDMQDLVLKARRQEAGFR